jgi:Fic family protein
LADASDDEATRIARLEIENGVKQLDLALDIIDRFLEPEWPFALRPTHIQELQRIAVSGIDPRPGEWRSGPVRISKSRHVPGPPHLVPFQVAEMCDYVNDNWHDKTAFHLAAYVMWRLNWIHPFADGNGRTSRIVSYIVLCTRVRTRLPGSPTIPEQIQADRRQYFRALEAADEAMLQGVLNVSEMETVIRSMLARQLLSVIEQADGGTG